MDPCKPVFVEKSGRYQHLTNFLLTKPEGQDKTCPRFCAMNEVLKSSKAPSIQTAKDALRAAAHRCTRYSQVYNLSNGEVHVFFNHDFEHEKKFTLVEELKSGARERALTRVFDLDANYVRLPEATGGTCLSAEEILTKSVEARGGWVR